MYLTITPQDMSSTYSASAADFVDYLEKENEGKHPDLAEPFFDQYNDKLDRSHVILEIDNNTAKLRKTEPRFYSITINPSKRELQHLKQGDLDLKAYTREVMKSYAQSFNRDREVSVDDIKYYAKIEHRRSYKGFDREIKENAPYTKKIARLRNNIRKVERGEIKGDVKKMEKEIDRLFREIPHKIDGKPVAQGMQKPGMQTHVHIVISRRDASNTYSLSPGSRYKASQVELNGKTVKRGFDRDRFFQQAEVTFDRMFGYERNYAEKYSSRKLFEKDTKQYFRELLQLSRGERKVAMGILRQTGVHIPTIPTSKVQLALKTIKQLKKAMDVGKDSGWEY